MMRSGFLRLTANLLSGSCKIEAIVFNKFTPLVGGISILWITVDLLLQTRVELFTWALQATFKYLLSGRTLKIERYHGTFLLPISSMNLYPCSVDERDGQSMKLVNQSSPQVSHCLIRTFDRHVMYAIGGLNSRSISRKNRAWGSWPFSPLSVSEAVTKYKAVSNETAGFDVGCGVRLPYREMDKT